MKTSRRRNHLDLHQKAVMELVRASQGSPVSFDSLVLLSTHVAEDAVIKLIDAGYLRVVGVENSIYYLPTRKGLAYFDIP